MTAAFPLVSVSGPPLERGRQYGRQAGERIAVSVSIYAAAFASAEVDWGVVQGRAKAFLPRLEAYDGALAEEIRGIAEGAGRPVEDIVALNARTELLYGEGSEFVAKQALDDGCTGAVVLPDASANGHLLHGQNWDWLDACVGSALVLRIDLGAAGRLLTFCEAGVVGRAGLNSHGVALTGNFLECEQTAAPRAVPIPLVRRRVLEADSLPRALREIMRAPRSFANNMMVSQIGGEGEGEAVDLETTPQAVFWDLPEEELLVHANHFRSAAALARIHDLGVERSSDSLIRERRVTRRLRAKRGAVTLEDMKAAFDDRFGAPRAVCRSPAPGEPGGEHSTVATILMDVTERVLWAAPAPYLGAHYKEYRLYD
ncbi:MAG: C45 family autoproteolytic acyltransferase/hydolase [Rhodospirillales bacterium]